MKKDLVIDNCDTPIKPIETINIDDIILLDDAYPTSRVLDGSYDHGYNSEWQQKGRLPDGRNVLISYLFDEDEEKAAGEEAENLPWDNDHIRRIILSD